jgi:hypothetical protein
MGKKVAKICRGACTIESRTRVIATQNLILEKLANQRLTNG